MQAERAFAYEEGQFICHIYVDVSPENRQIIDDITQVVRSKQAESLQHSALFTGWVPISGASSGAHENNLHLTLLRGHRAIYYHQIKSLVEAIKSECEGLGSFSLCLDDIRIFQNFESSKQFLCIAPQPVASSLAPLNFLREKLKLVVDRFATKLSKEDETPDSMPHCSFMSREIRDLADPDQSSREIRDQCVYDLGEDNITCFVRVKQIQVKIGNHVYTISLSETH